jgi:hypothetical protein
MAVSLLLGSVYGAGGLAVEASDLESDEGIKMGESNRRKKD